MYCLLLHAKVVPLAFKLLLHKPFLRKERKINNFIAVIVLLVIASLVRTHTISILIIVKR